jgi:hypothetical protein
MRQVLRLPQKIVLVLIQLSLLTACEGVDDILLFKNVGDPQVFQTDEDFNVELETVDIEIETSEEMTLNVLQPVLFSHQNLPLYLYLDDSDASELENLCVNADDGGSVSYTASRTAGQPHEEDDTIALSYENCVTASGDVFNGSMSASYSEIIGLNNTFIEVDTGYCVNRLQDELDVNGDDVVYLTANDVRFKPVASNIEIEAISVSYDDETGAYQEEVINTFSVPNSVNAIVVNETKGVEEGALVSIGGDQVYSIEDGESKKEDCQKYDRTLTAQLDGFSVQTDTFTATIDGEVDIFESSDNFTRFDRYIVNSDFSITIDEGASTREFTMTDFEIKQSLDFSENSYHYSFSGNLSSEAISGQLFIRTTNALKGLIDDYPHAGVVVLNARDLEQILLVMSAERIVLQVDADGDSDGNGVTDVDRIFSTSWQDLVQRDFLLAD